MTTFRSSFVTESTHCNPLFIWDQRRRFVFGRRSAPELRRVFGLYDVFLPIGVTERLRNCQQSHMENLSRDESAGRSSCAPSRRTHSGENELIGGDNCREDDFVAFYRRMCLAGGPYLINNAVLAAELRDEDVRKLCCSAEANNSGMQKNDRREKSAVRVERVKTPGVGSSKSMKNSTGGGGGCGDGGGSGGCCCGGGGGGGGGGREKGTEVQLSEANATNPWLDVHKSLRPRAADVQSNVRILVPLTGGLKSLACAWWALNQPNATVFFCYIVGMDRSDVHREVLSILQFLRYARTHSGTPVMMELEQTMSEHGAESHRQSRAQKSNESAGETLKCRKTTSKVRPDGPISRTKCGKNKTSPVQITNGAEKMVEAMETEDEQSARNANSEKSNLEICSSRRSFTLRGTVGDECGGPRKRLEKTPAQNPSTPANSTGDSGSVATGDACAAFASAAATAYAADTASATAVNAESDRIYQAVMKSPSSRIKILPMPAFPYMVDCTGWNENGAAGEQLRHAGTEKPHLNAPQLNNSGHWTAASPSEAAVKRTGVKYHPLTYALLYRQVLNAAQAFDCSVVAFGALGGGRELLERFHEIFAGVWRHTLVFPHRTHAEVLDSLKAASLQSREVWRDSKEPMHTKLTASASLMPDVAHYASTCSATTSAATAAAAAAAAATATSTATATAAATSTSTSLVPKNTGGENENGADKGARNRSKRRNNDCKGKKGKSTDADRSRDDEDSPLDSWKGEERGAEKLPLDSKEKKKCSTNDCGAVGVENIASTAAVAVAASYVEQSGKGTGAGGGGGERHEFTSRFRKFNWCGKCIDCFEWRLNEQRADRCSEKRARNGDESVCNEHATDSGAAASNNRLDHLSDSPLEQYNLIDAYRNILARENALERRKVVISATEASKTSSRQSKRVAKKPFGNAGVPKNNNNNNNNAASIENVDARQSAAAMKKGGKSTKRSGGGFLGDKGHECGRARNGVSRKKFIGNSRSEAKGEPGNAVRDPVSAKCTGACDFSTAEPVGILRKHLNKRARKEPSNSSADNDCAEESATVGHVTFEKDKHAEENSNTAGKRRKYSREEKERQKIGAKLRRKQSDLELLERGAGGNDESSCSMEEDSAASKEANEAGYEIHNRVLGSSDEEETCVEEDEDDDEDNDEDEDTNEDEESGDIGDVDLENEEKREFGVVEDSDGSGEENVGQKVGSGDCVERIYDGEGDGESDKEHSGDEIDDGHDDKNLGDEENENSDEGGEEEEYVGEDGDEEEEETADDDDDDDEFGDDVEDDEGENDDLIEADDDGSGGGSASGDDGDDDFY